MYKNPTLPIEDRANDLLARMTLDEKIGQMQQATCDDPKFLDLVRQGLLGSMINITGSWEPDLVKRANEYQRVAVEESRLGIPLLMGRDVIHGCRTMLPIPLGQAASFNPELVEKGSACAAEQARAYGINWAFAPMVDIARDPRWGRIAEGGGEDPLLTGRMGAAVVRGFQGTDLSAPDRVAACAKHYVAYGAAEGGRDYNTTWVPDVLLRNLYLPPFRACVDAGAATVMSAFNCINGVPASGNCFTIRQILKGDWGFEGLVVSDWDSIAEMVKHGYAADSAAAAEAGVCAGVDVEMFSTCYADSVPALLQEGRLSGDMVDESVRRVLRLKFRMGLFERPYTDEARARAIPQPAHLDLARKMAVETCVLLQNSRAVLPLSREIRSLAVIGPLADSRGDQQGTWNTDGREEDTVTVLDALRERLAGRCEVRYVKGVSGPRNMDTSEFPAACEAAAAADAVVLVLGEPSCLSGESHSRTELNLPGAQQQLLEAVAAAAGKPVVLVVMAGRPLVLTNVIDKVGALIWAWHPGTMGGPAIVDLLFGDEAPSAKLPVSFPSCLGQVPVYYACLNTGRPPREKYQPDVPEGTPLNPIGFTSAYVDASHRPLFPFGFGLTYTTFAYANLTLSSERLGMRDTLRVECDVTNTGKRDGVEVVQLYLRDESASLVRPVRELKDFLRVPLSPGATRRVSFELGRRELSFLDAAGREILEPGRFHVWIGGSSQAQLGATFVLQDK